jgi:hypothetical protein
VILLRVLSYCNFIFFFFFLNSAAYPSQFRVHLFLSSGLFLYEVESMLISVCCLLLEWLSRHKCDLTVTTIIYHPQLMNYLDTLYS